MFAQFCFNGARNYSYVTLFLNEMDSNLCQEIARRAFCISTNHMIHG